MRFRFIAIGWCFVALLWSCKSDPVEGIDFGFEYMPLEIGASIEYQVDSTVYNDFDNSITTHSYFIKEWVADTFSDGEGRTVYRIERSKKVVDSSDYVIISSYGLTKDGLRLERLVNNKRIVALVFPPNRTSQWDGNAFNDDDKQTFYYDQVHAPEVISGVTYDSTILAIHVVDTVNFIRKEFRGERYAKNVGLVEIETVFLETKLNGDSGLVYTQRRIE